MKFERDKRTGTYYSADGRWMIEKSLTGWDVYQLTETGDYKRSFAADRPKEAKEIIESEQLRRDQGL